MKILSFGYDSNLLLPEDPRNEGQYRQRRYCELLGQEKRFVVLDRDAPREESVLAAGRVRSYGAAGRSLWTRCRSAHRLGLEIGREFRPDIVEYQDPRIVGWVAWRVARRLGVPLVGGLFNDFIDDARWLAGSPGRRLLNAQAKLVLAKSRGVRCDSARTTEALRAKGFANLRHVPFFVPWLERFAVDDEAQRQRLRRWAEDPLVLCVARLAREKNLPLLLRALARATGAAGRGRLVLVGAGSERQPLERLAADLGIAARTRFAGAVDYFALPEHYRAASIFALSSDSETSARVLILAQAARLPTVTTATSGSAEIVADRSTGFVTPLGDEAAFADRLALLVADEAAYRAQLAARFEALDRFGESAITTGLRAFYESLHVEPTDRAA
ncbi:MAG: glycosyltransferase [Deltaproteobacteria bacterium]|nr:glycosyltransferase [Deltaproteobacteria bacterium]